MGAWLINDEFKKIWKEAVLAYLRPHPSISLKVLR
jgi:hypothetical protein